MSVYIGKTVKYGDSGILPQNEKSDSTGFIVTSVATTLHNISNLIKTMTLMLCRDVPTQHHKDGHWFDQTDTEPRT